MSPPGLRDVYDRLLDAQGPQGWWPAETPTEMAIGAILTQNTAWTRVEAAMMNLRAAGLLDARRLADLPADALAGHLKPSGYFNLKARRLKALAAFLVDELDGDPARLARLPLEQARARLLAVPGVGRETADSILLYAAGHPIFVIDAYTRRLVERLRLADPTAPYDDLRHRFERELPREVPLYNDFHAQIVIHAKNRCRKRPRCQACPLKPDCAFGSGGAG